MSSSTQLLFHDTNFNLITKENQVWLSAPEIAQALGYKSDDAISRIYRRNSDEFSSDMSETVKLTVSGNYEKTVRCFSLRGAHLVAMLSRTTVAKEFRKWVLDVLDKQVEDQPSQPPSYSTRVALTIENGQVVHSSPIPDDAFIVTKNRLCALLNEPGLFSIEEMAKVAQCSSRRIAEMAQAVRRLN